MASKGFVKIHREFTDWRWYQDGPCVRTLLHLIVTANHKEVRFQNIVIKPGQRIFTRASLSSETGLSDKQIRRALSLLESSGEICRARAGKYTLVTLLKWEQFQIQEETGAGKGPSKGPSKGPTEQEDKKKRSLSNLPDRKVRFKSRVIDAYTEIRANLEMPTEEVNEFYIYWTEHNDKGWTMRFEKEGTWDTKGRLRTWNKNWKSRQGKKSSTSKTAGEAWREISKQG